MRCMRLKCCSWNATTQKSFEMTLGCVDEFPNREWTRAFGCPRALVFVYAQRALSASSSRFTLRRGIIVQTVISTPPQITISNNQRHPLTWCVYAYHETVPVLLTQHPHQSSFRAATLSPTGSDTGSVRQSPFRRQNSHAGQRETTP